MYLSCLELDQGSESTYRHIVSPYRIHALVEAACSGNAGSSSGESTEGRILWRLDVSEFSNAARLFIVSPSAPDSDLLCKRLSLDCSAIRTKEYDERLDGLQAGQLWTFRLKANPVRKVLVDKGLVKRDGVVGTLQAEVTSEQQIDWLLKRCEGYGFRIPLNAAGEPQVRVSQSRKERFARSGKQVTLGTARYDGLLEISDAELFRKALVCGIGRAKGFGCGLLTIAKP